MLTKLLTASLVLSILCGLNLAHAHDFQVGSLRIVHPYTTPSLSRNGAVYFKAIQNEGQQDDELLGARTPAAASVELHAMRMQGDVMTMRAQSAIVLPAGSSTPFTHGQAHGYHVMLIGLHKPLKDGDRFPVWLRFKHAGEKEVMVWVQTPKNQATSGAHQH